MADERAIRVEGLGELRRALKQAEDFDSLREIGSAFAEVADLVARRAAAAARGSGRKVDSHLADSYRASRGAAKASVRVGDPSRPWVIGQEWGAYQDRIRPVRSGSRHQQVGWRQFPEIVRGGRFLYPALASEGDRIREAIGDAIERALSD